MGTGGGDSGGGLGLGELGGLGSGIVFTRMGRNTDAVSSPCCIGVAREDFRYHSDGTDATLAPWTSNNTAGREALFLRRQ